MKAYPASAIHNVAVVGHNGVGKTTLVSALLHEAGATPRFGRVEEGNAPTDFDPEEVERKISIGLAVASLEWKKKKINLIDTPGYGIFVSEMICGLRAADAALLVVDAVAGVEVQTEKAWKVCEELGLPRLIVVNRMDRERADGGRVMDQLQKKFGRERVFDTSLSEEGIIGRAVGMAIGGLMPVAEIQFRKYADPATEQLNNCGTLRWRTANRFAAPIVVRMPGGFGKDVGDPWHSLSAEVVFAHAIGWQVAMPSNSADAVGLLRAAMRGRNPTIFFEHRSLLMTSDGSARYPGDDYVVPFGRAKKLRDGNDITVVTWGAMVHRCVHAAEQFGEKVDLLDLRTVAPWDRDAVLESVRKTGRVLIVHEDTLTAGFGAEIAATVARAAFWSLDAPVDRLAVEDVPMPYHPDLLSAVLPSVATIAERIDALLSV